MTHLVHRSRLPATLRAGLGLALTVGIADVAIALLQRPEGFAAADAPAPAILATAALTCAVYLLAVWPIRRAAQAMGGDRDRITAAWVALLGVGVVVGLLAGVPSSFGANPHTLFRLAAAGAIGLACAAGAYALFDPGATRRGVGLALAVTRAMPLLLLELLVAEWVGIYAVDSLASVAGVFILVSLGVALAATLGAFIAAGSPRPAERSIAFILGVLVLAPVLGALWPAAAGSPAASSPDRRPRHVILITIDTLRADALSSYGPLARPTPAIDALASDGVLFETAVAPAPWTLPSLTSILTGLSPSVHQAVGFTSRLAGNATTLAEQLRRKGYHTAAIVHNDLLTPTRNLSQGFDEYVDLHEPWFADSVGATLLQQTLPGAFPPRSWPSTAEHTQVALDWIDAHHESDFFLWLHYLDPHAPYAPPAEFLTGTPAPGVGAAFEGQKLSMEGVVVPSHEERRWIRALYDSEVRYVDQNVGRLVSALKRLQVYDDALIVLTSDHGEEFWEHGALGHGHSMYSELLDVPLIVKVPGSEHRGRVTAPVSTVSIAPTILDLVGVQYSAGDLSAQSLVPLIAPDGGAYEARPIVSTAQMLFDRRETARFDHYRYIVSRIDGREELYDLARDPQERRSVAETAPEALDTGRAALRRDATTTQALARRLGIAVAATAMDADTQRRLRSLGYVR